MATVRRSATTTSSKFYTAHAALAAFCLNQDLPRHGEKILALGMQGPPTPSCEPGSEEAELCGIMAREITRQLGTLSDGRASAEVDLSGKRLTPQDARFVYRTYQLRLARCCYECLCPARAEWHLVQAMQGLPVKEE